jgi:UDP-2,3-diacylglucosamine pyrophosphatase LpxH
MKYNPTFRFLCLLILAGQAMLLPSCKKSEPVTEPEYLTVTLPRSVLQNETYYSLDYRERSIELAFSLPVDSSSVAGNISFSDKSGTLDTRYKTISSGKKVILAFHQDFQMKPGWKYKVALKAGLRSTSGVTFRSTEEIDVRTSAKQLGVENDTSQRNSILCISDIHMGDPRSVARGYCWFSKNAAALDSLLALALTSPQVKQVVILGDLFDGWVIPYRVPPFDTAAGIYNIRDYFISVANAPVNAGIINKLRAIATAADQQLIYIPGNHDMLLTQEILREIIPGVIWGGDSPGLGHYSPVDEIVMEHGHRYDFFNCPQPLAIPGHILPPGYFVSRLDAEGLMEQSGHNAKTTQTGAGSVEFLTAWTAAIEYLKFHYSMTVAADSANILMGGIDGYAAPFSFNGIRDLYAENIENVWPATQAGNAVPVAMPVVMAILDGSLDLSFTAAYEYMQSPAPRFYKIVAFGHTHNPMLKVYPSGKNYTGIYANTGSWVNAELTSKPVRTFLVIKPGAWTGSDLDVVSLYQYNLNSGSGNPDPGYIPVLIAEESIGR